LRDPAYLSAAAIGLGTFALSMALNAEIVDAITFAFLAPAAWFCVLTVLIMMRKP
jgi:hypothetical protein